MELSQVLKGLLPTLVLAVVAEGDTYGYGVLAEFRRRGLDGVGDASVYGTLQRLFDEGHLASYVVAPTIGPSRRYYSLTTSGQHELKQGIEFWEQFSETVGALLRPRTAD